MKVIEITLKVSDRFFCNITNNGKSVVNGYEDYVPNFMPDDHYGDYVILEINAETGQILNWRPNASRLVDQFIEENKDLS